MRLNRDRHQTWNAFDISVDLFQFNFYFLRPNNDAPKIPRVVFFVSRNSVAQEDPVIIILLAIGLHVGQPDALESQEIDE